jgi:microcompartment protein CcmK/EutM
MRIGIVRGHVVLARSVEALQGTRLLVVEPVNAENLAGNNGRGGGTPLIVADHLAPATGQMVGFTEGREAANPYWPGEAPVDAYAALIVESTDFRTVSKESDGTK